MSTVLSPIGPQPPRVYWMRRVFVLGLPLILIIVIAVSCAGGGSKSPSASTSGLSSPGSTTTSHSGGACVPADLSATLSTSPTIYPVGQSPIFVGTITNMSTASCQLTTSPSNETWTVESGPDHFWTTGGCPRSKVASAKTLAAGASRKVSITWDGHRLLPGCKPGESASPGTYHLHATLDGVAAEQVTFHFTKNTQ
jgi:hypothetical protein